VLDDQSAGGSAAGGEGRGEQPRRVVRGGASTVLAAAMIAVGEVFEPHKTGVEIVRPADESDDDLGFDLDFGDLPEI
jgi:hypothetical protein